MVRRFSMALAVAVAILVTTGCAAVQAAAPALLAGVERVLVDGIEAAEDGARRRELKEALALLEQCRAAQRAAEDAARRATEAAVLAQKAAERAANERELVERATAEQAQRELRRSLLRLGLAGRLQPSSTGPGAGDAGMDGAP